MTMSKGSLFPLLFRGWQGRRGAVEPARVVNSIVVVFSVLYSLLVCCILYRSFAIIPSSWILIFEFWTIRDWDRKQGMNGIGKTSRSRLEMLMLSKPAVIKHGEWEKVESKAMERSQHSMADRTLLENGPRRQLANGWVEINSTYSFKESWVDIRIFSGHPVPMGLWTSMESLDLATVLVSW